MRRFAIPERHWDKVRRSWMQRDPSLYSRLDLVYGGNGPAKLLENNADTPTSLYESGFWQWLWLENLVDNSMLPRQADQFNSLQEKLINRFGDIAAHYQIQQMHFACCKDTDEDRGTVQYLQDCAQSAGVQSDFVFIDDRPTDRLTGISSADGDLRDSTSDKTEIVCNKQKFRVQ